MKKIILIALAFVLVSVGVFLFISKDSLTDFQEVLNEQTAETANERNETDVIQPITKEDLIEIYGAEAVKIEEEGEKAPKLKSESLRKELIELDYYGGMVNDLVMGRDWHLDIPDEELGTLWTPKGFTTEKFIEKYKDKAEVGIFKDDIVGKVSSTFLYNDSSNPYLTVNYTIGNEAEYNLYKIIFSNEKKFGTRLIDDFAIVYNSTIKDNTPIFSGSDIITYIAKVYKAEHVGYWNDFGFKKDMDKEFKTNINSEPFLGDKFNSDNIYDITSWTEDNSIESYSYNVADKKHWANIKVMVVEDGYIWSYFYKIDYETGYNLELTKISPNFVKKLRGSKFKKWLDEEVEVIEDEE